MKYGVCVLTLHLYIRLHRNEVWSLCTYSAVPQLLGSENDGTACLPRNAPIRPNDKHTQYSHITIKFSFLTPFSHSSWSCRYHGSLAFRSLFWKAALRFKCSFFSGGGGGVARMGLFVPVINVSNTAAGKVPAEKAIVQCFMHWASVDVVSQSLYFLPLKSVEMRKLVWVSFVGAEEGVWIIVNGRWQLWCSSILDGPFFLGLWLMIKKILNTLN